MVEQEAVNFEVAGSSPASGAIRLALLAHGFQPGRQSAANVLSECNESKDSFYMGLFHSFHSLMVYDLECNRKAVGRRRMELVECPD